MKTNPAWHILQITQSAQNGVPTVTSPDDVTQHPHTSRRLERGFPAAVFRLFPAQRWKTRGWESVGGGGKMTSYPTADRGVTFGKAQAISSSPVRRSDVAFLVKASSLVSNGCLRNGVCEIDAIIGPNRSYTTGDLFRYCCCCSLGKMVNYRRCATCIFILCV